MTCPNFLFLTKMNNFTFKEATDYGIFKHLDYNRPVLTNTSQFKKLKKNIEEKGYLISPVICNGDGYIIDGQHRVEACKQLGIPVPYVINHRMTTQDVKDANNLNRSWDLMAYTHNAAKHGDLECEALLDVANEYNEDFSFPVIADAFSNSQGGANSAIKNKVYKIDLDFGHGLLETARELKSVVGSKFKQAKVVRALKMVLRQNPHFDVDHFKLKCTQKKFHVYNSETETAEEMVEVYNYYTVESSRIRL